MAVILAAVAWLLTYLLHSTVLLVGAIALAGLGVVRSHAGRDTLWKVALAGGLLTATAQMALRLQPPAGHLALAARPESPLIDVTAVRAVARAAEAVAPAESPVVQRFASDIALRPTSHVPRPKSTSLISGLHISWPAILLNFWFVGALGFGARLLWARHRLVRDLQSRRSLTDGPLADALGELSAYARVAPPRLSVSHELAGPIAFGGEICLPERVLSRLAPSEQRAVLAHELGHVVRRDPAWLMAAALIENLLFLQPLNRVVRRRLRAESEFLCDDWAAERTGGVVLARCLAEVAGWVQGHSAPAAVAGMAGHCSQLVSRVERLLDGSTGIRPVRWIVRAAAGAGAMALVACSVPGVAAEDLNGAPPAARASVDEPAPLDVASTTPGNGWGVVTDDGRLLLLSAGYTVRLTGHGRLGFRQYGRALVIPDGYELRVNGETVADERELCDQSGAVRIVETDGDGAWDVVPVRRSGTSFASASSSSSFSSSFSSSSSTSTSTSRSTSTRWAEAHADADASTDAALNGEADAAIDTLVQLWIRDPASVRRAARRIARNYDRDLRPQFESLGVDVGRELAPRLERLTSRLGRDLSPEFARMGAALGASILADLASSPDPDAGAGDYRGKKPKNH